MKNVKGFVSHWHRSMNTLALTSGGVAALAVATTFAWRLQKERRDVWNRGVNQSPLLTLWRALAYTLYRAIIYGVLGYLLITGYYVVKFRNRCNATAASRAAYEAAPVSDHLLEALRWPVTYQDGPSCLAEIAP